MGIDGTWYNELGSKMVLIADGPGGLKGTYSSSVGGAGTFELVGRYDPTSTASQSAVVAWVVRWSNDSNDFESVTSWSGQYQLGADDTEEIVSMWLLTRREQPSDDWASTFVGKDTFRRNPPSIADASAMASRGATSHPSGA